MDDALQNAICGFSKKKLKKQTTVDKSGPALDGKSKGSKSGGGSLPPRSNMPTGNPLFGGGVPSLPKKSNTAPRPQTSLPNLPPIPSNTAPRHIPNAINSKPKLPMQLGQSNKPPPPIQTQSKPSNNKPTPLSKPVPNLPPRPVNKPSLNANKDTGNPPPLPPKRPGMKPPPGMPLRDDSLLPTPKPRVSSAKQPPPPTQTQSKPSISSTNKLPKGRKGDYGPKEYLRFTFDLALPPPPRYKGLPKVYPSGGRCGGFDEPSAPVLISHTQHNKQVPSMHSTTLSPPNPNTAPLPPNTSNTAPHLPSTLSNKAPIPISNPKLPNPGKPSISTGKPPPPSQGIGKPPPPAPVGLNGGKKPPPPKPGVGGKPPPPKPQNTELEKLKSELNGALSRKDYKKCKELKDRIRALESGVNSNTDNLELDYNQGKTELEDRIQDCAKNMNFELCVTLKNKLSQLVSLKKQYDSGDTNVVTQIYAILNNLN